MDWELARFDILCSIFILATVIPATAQELCAETKKWCENGYCCNSGQCCLYYHETWWFWLIWGLIFLLASCCFYQREKVCRCWRPHRPHRPSLIEPASNPYQHIVPLYDPCVRLPSYDEVPILSKGPPPEYHEVFFTPVLPSSQVQERPIEGSSERDWEIPEGLPPPPYSPQLPS